MPTIALMADIEILNAQVARLEAELAEAQTAKAALEAALPLIVFAVQFELGEGDVTWERCRRVWTETVLPSLDKKHDGDCVKQPQVCFRCQAEECIKVAGLIRAALSDAGAGWLEVREQVRDVLNVVARKYHHSRDHTIGFEDCYVPECYDARAALAALEVT